ncbi:hypothetical protein HXX76_015081 [Chlamydomonas incerta]|uniref:Beta-adaptin appendage C-terminal subdomain domain-containing protein n=1 Tax=Chlamydomonas incerta TaxID=51695 RepID=A0A835SDT2_CHLIN|nr:hypothetical protein HXX76_015081 [Chlamydomonas incerta]|eukprot:KAG2423691.1 hypothetical protein HXX76_015081 [Chlamydomonas incerta]
MSENARSKPRGELAELSAQLQNLCTAGKRSDKELRAAKKDVFKKVINYMTLGMDMSALFPMMTSCANLSSDDLVLKKMLYLYLTHYATQTPDLALLTINQLQKDSADHDPMIRGLALRSLCSLRVTNFLEYVVTPIMAGLSDRHPYVRRTAVMGVLKVYHIDPNTVAQQGMVERVKRLLGTDTDVQVIANCLSVLMQLEPPARLAEKVLVYSLLNRIKEFSDWGQCQVLELASYYVPSSEAEVYDMLNALEDRMGHVNSAVVLATIRVFLRLTINMTATHQQVLERIREPLKTLISREDAPTVYAALCHVLLLAQRAPMIFEGDCIAFFCRTHDPWFVKKVKLEILTAIASSNNVYDIVTELTEYARDISPTMAREAVRAVGRIALAVPDSGGIIERLLMFLDGGSEHLIAEALVALKDVLRRYPDVAAVCVGGLGELGVHGAIEEPAARAAYVWILGQFGTLVPDAPYLLEAFAHTFAAEEPPVRLALLSAAAGLFFRRPPEAKPLLGAVLAAGTADSDVEVRDRALLYYRLLRADPAAAERVIAPPLMTVPWFSETLSGEAKDAIFADFNSLSVVFNKPAASFIERQAYHSLEAEPEPPAPAPATDLLAMEAPELLGADRATNLLADTDGADLMGGPTGDGSGAGPGGGGAADLLDLDIGGLGLGGGPSGPMGSGMGGGGAGMGGYGGPAGPGGPGGMMGPQAGYGMGPGPAGGPGFAPPAPTMAPAQASPLDLLGGFGPGPMGPPPPQQQLQRPQQPPPPHGMMGPPPGHMPPPMHQQQQPPRGPQMPPQQQPGLMMGGGIGGMAPPPGLGGPGGMPGMPPPLQQQQPRGPPPMQAPVTPLGPPGAMRGPGGGGDLLGLDGLGAAPAPAPASQELVLNPKARVSPAEFQAEWKRLPAAHSSSLAVSAANVAAITANNHRDFTTHMTQAYIHTIASGGQSPNFRYYFYGQTVTGTLYLVEMLLRADPSGGAGGSATTTVKTASPDPGQLAAFVELWSNCLAGFMLA